MGPLDIKMIALELSIKSWSTVPGVHPDIILAGARKYEAYLLEEV